MSKMLLRGEEPGRFVARLRSHQSFPLNDTGADLEVFL